MEDVVETGITLRLWKSVLNSATQMVNDQLCHIKI